MLLNCSIITCVCSLQNPAGLRSRRLPAPVFPFDSEFARVNPIEWKNVILYSEVKIDPDKLRIQDR